MLSTFIYEPIAGSTAFGWRPTCRNEQLAYYYFWRDIGERMGIRDIPPTYEAFEAWARAYERATFRYTETNRKIGAATRDLFAGWYPKARRAGRALTASTPCSTTRCSRPSASRGRIRC